MSNDNPRIHQDKYGFYWYYTDEAGKPGRYYPTRKEAELEFEVYGARMKGGADAAMECVRNQRNVAHKKLALLREELETLQQLLTEANTNNEAANAPTTASSSVGDQS